MCIHSSESTDLHLDLLVDCGGIEYSHSFTVKTPSPLPKKKASSYHTEEIMYCKTSHAGLKLLVIFCSCAVESPSCCPMPGAVLLLLSATIQFVCRDWHSVEARSDRMLVFL